jgi:hypothetical protein
VFSGAMNGQQNAAFQSFGLLRGWRLERLRMGTEPHLDNAVTAQTRIHATGNGFDLWQFGHGFIVKRQANI